MVAIYNETLTVGKNLFVQRSTCSGQNEMQARVFKRDKRTADRL